MIAELIRIGLVCAVCGGGLGEGWGLGGSLSRAEPASLRCTHLFYRCVLQAVLGMGMGMGTNVTAKTPPCSILSQTDSYRRLQDRLHGACSRRFEGQTAIREARFSAATNLSSGSCLLVCLSYRLPLGQTTCHLSAQSAQLYPTASP